MKRKTLILKNIFKKATMNIKIIQNKILINKKKLTTMEHKN